MDLKVKQRAPYNPFVVNSYKEVRKRERQEAREARRFMKMIVKKQKSTQEAKQLQAQNILMQKMAKNNSVKNSFGMNLNLEDIDTYDQDFKKPPKTTRNQENNFFEIEDSPSSA